MNNYIAEATGLSKSFKDFWGRDKVKAVNDISFQVKSGSILGLLGPNGSGKSTTIKMLLGFLKPTSGSIKIFGKPPGSAINKRRIGYLPEESYLYPFLSGPETLDFFGGLYDLNKKVRRERAEQLLAMVGLSQVKDRKVGEFSKGMARRIGLAQALIGDPEVLILDEPTTGLDPIGIVEMKALIVDLKSRGKTIIVSSHLLSDMQDICDDVYILYGGKVCASGSLDELLADQNRFQVNFEKLNKDERSRVEKALSALDISFKISHPRNNLEQFFMQVIHSVAQQETSGSQLGKGTPEFMAKESKEILQSLLKKDKPEEPEENRELIEDLVKKEEVEEEVKPDQDLLSSLMKKDKENGE